MDITLRDGMRGRMLLATKGQDANDITRTYPPGALGVVSRRNEDAEPPGWDVVVGPQDDSSIVVTIQDGDDVATIIRPVDELPGQIHAKAVPWSSVVGNGLLITDPNGRVIGQLSLREFGGSRAVAEAIVARLRDAINFAEGERLARHVKGGVYTVLGEATGQDADKSSLASIEGLTVIVYRGHDRMWFRRPGEFDAKFGDTEGQTQASPEASARPAEERVRSAVETD